MSISKQKTISWPLFGNANVIDFLSKSIKNNSVSSAYIFLGAKDLGKTTIAKYFAKSLMCIGAEETLPCEKCFSCKQFNNNAHFDFNIIERLNKEEDKTKTTRAKNISIEQIREFNKALGMSSFSGSYKFGVIKDADYLSEGAANSFLKTLEEPKRKVIIILIATNIDYLPATIKSRCQILNFFPVKFDLLYDYLIKEYKAPRSMAKNLARLSLGRPAKARKYLEDKDYYENYMKKAETFINFFQEDINGRFLEIEKLIGIKINGADSADMANEIIEIWEGLIRDLILLNLGQNNIIRNEVFSKHLMAIKERVTLKELVKLSLILEEAKRNVKANVNSKLVLDSIAVNIA